MADSGDFATRYRGWTYQKCSRHGLFLVKRAAETENWFGVVDELVALRAHMELLRKLGTPTACPRSEREGMSRLSPMLRMLQSIRRAR